MGDGTVGPLNWQRSKIALPKLTIHWGVWGRVGVQSEAVSRLTSTITSNRHGKLERPILAPLGQCLLDKSNNNDCPLPDLWVELWLWLGSDWWVPATRENQMKNHFFFLFCFATFKRFIMWPVRSEGMFALNFHFHTAKWIFIKIYWSLLLWFD